MPSIIGAVLSRGLATMHELDTSLGTEDLFDLVEIVAVDAYNQRAIVNQQRS